MQNVFPSIFVSTLKGFFPGYTIKLIFKIQYRVIIVNAKKKHLKSNSILACKWGKVSDPSQFLVALIAFLKTTDIEHLCISYTCLFFFYWNFLNNLPMLIVFLILRFTCSVYSPSLNMWFANTFSQSVDFSLNCLSSVFQRARVFNFILIVLSLTFLKSCVHCQNQT